jgi:hypothetical protein
VCLYLQLHDFGHVEAHDKIRVIGRKKGSRPASN